MDVNFRILLVFVLMVAVHSQENGLRMEFQRIMADQSDLPQIITEIYTDLTSTDTFQVMCKVNNVNELFKLTTLRVQYKTISNNYTDLAILQNVDDTNADTYQKPVLAQGGSSGWTATGSFDTTTSNGRDTTLGASRPVSTVTCSNAVEYRCHLAYTKPEYSNYETANGEISKILEVHVFPTTIFKTVFNESSGGHQVIQISDPIDPFWVGQKVRLECAANVGTYSTSAQIRWMKRSPGISLEPFPPNEHISGNGTSTSCVYSRTDSVSYVMGVDDTPKGVDDRLYFQCYVHIASLNWSTPYEQRQHFFFRVYLPDGYNRNDGCHVVSETVLMPIIMISTMLVHAKLSAVPV